MRRLELKLSPELLSEYGALLEVEVTVPLPLKRYLERQGYPPHPAIRGLALIDTGAGASGVDERVMEELDIPALESIETLSPHGVSSSSVYNASVAIPQLGRSDIALRRIVGCYLRDQEVPGDLPLIMLLGRDLLQGMVLIYDGARGAVTVEI